jgi:predicted aspartyl protease
MSPSRTPLRSRLRAAVATVSLLLVASCAASAPSAPPSFAFTSKLQIPSFTGGCPASTVTKGPDRTVVIPLRIVTPSPVISQIFAAVCLNGHGPYPFVVDTGSHDTLVDAALARRLGLISASATSGMHLCDGPQKTVSARLSAGPYVFGQDRQVLVTDLASPSAPLMGILGADALSTFGVDRIDYQAQTLTVPAPAAGGAAPASLSAGTTHRIQLSPSGNYQLMTVTAGNAHGRLLLDTGAQGTTLTPAFAQQAHLAKASPVTTQTYAGAGCTRTVSYYTARDWSIGGFPLAPQPVGSVPDFLVADGSFGSGTLQRYSPVVIDYQHHELLLGPLRK